ncbi:MAG: HEAT repeat domain-containing protein [Alphaproteobacteria bacterium]|nr:HEAT repeat domain-containing protein [Alphaproteobacteria bacterium]
MTLRHLIPLFALLFAFQPALSADTTLDASDPHLMNDAKRKTVNARAAEMEALGKQHDADSEKTLLETLANKELHHRIRSAASGALRDRKSEAAIPVYLAVLQDTSDNQYVRYSAALNLAWMKAVDAIPALRTALQDQEAFVRTGAASALGLLGEASAEAAPDLAKQVESDTNAKARREAASALSRIGVHTEAVAASLLKGLKDEDDWVRIYAAGALATMKEHGTAGIAEMIDQLGKPNSGNSLKEYYLKALGDFGELAAKQAAPVAAGALKDKEDDIRSSAVYALGKFGAEAKPYSADIIKLLSDSSDLVRMSAALAVGYLKLEEAIPTLKEMGTNPKGRNDRMSAISALGSIGTPEAKKLAEEFAEKGF